MSEIRVRLAPSPTGFMHIGNLRTALYDFLFARKHGGVFVLRIEDTDQTREVEGAVAQLLKTLEWAGIVPDEGPEQGGDFGPYIQSQRLTIYRTYVEQLLASGNAYWCDCSSASLAEQREYQERAGLKLGYAGTCRDKGLKTGEVVRLKVPREGETAFTDLIRGRISIPNADIDDQVLLKSDGFPTYHLAVVVDDHLMKISHVFRGEEWIASTPKHILLYEAFGWTPPLHAHLPLLLNPDKTKLSKRQGDVAVEDYIRKGYLPEALINFIALQGWNPRGDQEIYSVEELISSFDISKVNPSGAVVNWEKLDWFQGYYVRKMSDEELARSCVSFLDREVAPDMLVKIAGMVKDRLVQLRDINALSAFVFNLPEYDAELLVWKKSDAATARRMLTELLDVCDHDIYASSADFETAITHWISEKGYGNGDVLWPLRTALSGQHNSPPPFTIAYVLGREETVRRISIAIQKLA